MTADVLLKKYILKLLQKDDIFSLLTVWILKNPISFTMLTLFLLIAITFLIYHYLKIKKDVIASKEINFEALIKYIMDIKEINENFINKAEEFSKDLKNKIDSYMKEDMQLDADVKKSIDRLSDSISLLVRALTKKE